MKILIDLHAVQGRSSARGIGRYSSNLVQHLKAIDGLEIHFLISNSSNFMNQQELYQLLNGITKRSRIHVLPSFVGLNQNESTYLREAFIACLNVDWLLITDLFESQHHYPISINEHFSTPTAVVLYDLIPLEDPDEHFHTPGSRKVYDFALAQLQRASLIFCISEYTRNSLLDFFPNIAARTYVIGGGTTLESTGSINRTNNLVVIGGDHPRKNIRTLILAWSKIPLLTRNNYHLRIVGNFSSGSLANFNDLITSENILDHEITFVGEITDYSLAYLIENSVGLIHPAISEGLGLPILEAINLGIPVLCSKTTSMPEVGCDGALIDPLDTAQFASTLNDFLENEKFRSKIKESQSHILKTHNWDKSVNIILEAFNEFSTNHQKKVSFLEKLLIVSPHVSQKTGIARYSNATGKALSNYFEVTYMDPSSMKSMKETIKYFNKFDAVLIHLGNSSHHEKSFWISMVYPAHIFLHETQLAGTINSLPLNNDVQTFLASDEEPSTFSNQHWLKKILALSPSLIVHSERSKNNILKMGVKHLSTKVISHPFLGSSADIRSKNINNEIICIGTVGFANQNKRIDLIIQAISSFNQLYNKKLKLEVIGECDPEYNAFILNLAKKLNVQIEVTGFLTLEELHERIVKLDLAIQLRKLDSGEASGTIADLMHFEIPTIVNDAGPFIELDSSLVCKLESEPTIRSIVDSMVGLNNKNVRELLISKIRAHSESKYNVNKWAEEISKHIEDNHRRNIFSRTRVNRNFEIQNFDEFTRILLACHRELHKYDVVVVASDVSNLLSTNFISGIQRVVLELHKHLRMIFHQEIFELIGKDFKSTDTMVVSSDNPQIITEINLLRNSINIEDINVVFLLDLNFHFLDQSALESYRNRNVLVCSFVYDVLPLEHPEWFPIGTREMLFLPWLQKVRNFSDLIFVNSETVKRNLLKLDMFKDYSGEIHVIRLASFIDSKTSTHVRNNQEFLIVSTIEPRKGYSEVLDSFDLLCRKGLDPIFHIVGRQGWMTENIISRIEKHPLLGSKLFWHKEISDEKLLDLYSRVGATIAASFDEGFGLPIVESLSVKCPVIARHIPVFQEIDSRNIHFFGNGFPDLSTILEKFIFDRIQWFNDKESSDHEIIDDFSRVSQDVVRILKSVI